MYSGDWLASDDILFAARSFCGLHWFASSQNLKQKFIRTLCVSTIRHRWLPGFQWGALRPQHVLPGLAIVQLIIFQAHRFGIIFERPFFRRRFEIRSLNINLRLESKKKFLVWRGIKSGKYEFNFMNSANLMPGFLRSCHRFSALAFQFLRRLLQTRKTLPVY